MIPEHYPLTETTAVNYNRRTEWNARDSDATLILNEGELAGGTAYTITYAKKHQKPWRMVQLEQSWRFDETRAWLIDNKVQVLNIAGPRESKCQGINKRAGNYLKALLEGNYSAQY